MELLADYDIPNPDFTRSETIQVSNVYNGELRLYTIRYDTNSYVNILLGLGESDSETEEFDDECDIFRRRIKGYYVRRIFLQRIKRNLKEAMLGLNFIIIQ